MAGYMKLQRSIWLDQDYTALPAQAQRLYLLLASQPTISHVGVLAYTPGRWAHLAPDTTWDVLAQALADLEAAGYISVDRTTEEVLVRTYMRHDELWRVHNGPKALERAATQVLSPTLRAAVLDTLADLTGGGPVGGPVGGAQHQQPADSKLKPAASSHQPVEALEAWQAMTPGAAAAAAAAVETWVDWRVDTSQARNPAGYARRLRQAAATDHLPALRQRLEDQPDTSLADLCQDVLGMSPLDVHRYGATRAARLQGVA